MQDRMGREIRYVRVSVTDRCNLRCRYCMPPEGVPWLPHSEILRLEEIVRVVRALAGLGVTRVKLTGGEPLCRDGLPELARQLYALPGIEQVTLTTNGLLLPAGAQALAEAGIRRVNISIDSLRPDRYAALTRGGVLAQALDGVRAAQQAGMTVKLNVVPVCGVNDDELVDFVRFGRENGLVVRFIELMPIGLGAGQTGLPSDAVCARIAQAMPGFAPFPDKLGNGPADCYGWPDGGVFGVISAVHHKFCSSCDRIRLTADGLLRLCLAQPDGLDLKPYLRGGAAGLEDAIRQAVWNKPDGHSFGVHDPHDRTMNAIGG